MFINFFVEYYPKSKDVPVRNLSKIAMNYLKTTFILDLIPIIPFNYMDVLLNKDWDGYQNYFFLLKSIRMMRAFHLFNINVLMVKIKKVNMQTLT